MRNYPKRRDFDDSEEYARACHESGPPPPGVNYSFSSSGFYNQLMCDIFGSSPTEYDKALKAEARQRQNDRPNVFVRKHDDDN